MRCMLRGLPRNVIADLDDVLLAVPPEEDELPVKGPAAEAMLSAVAN